MDYESYRKAYYANPAPEPRFKFAGLHGATLYYEDYQEALAFYTRVLGPPAYIEGEHTHGWQVGETWLTLFPSKAGNPINVEVQFHVISPEEVDRLYQTFLDAGAKGDPPVETLMYRPVRMAVLEDPFGATVSVVCWLAV